MSALAPAAGLLCHNVIVQAAMEVNNDDGTVSEAWATADADDPTRRAQIEPLRGREYFEAQQMKAGTSHRITIRPWDGLTPRHRLLFGTRVFNIVSVLDIEERGVMMQVMCQEAV